MTQGALLMPRPLRGAPLVAVGIALFALGAGCKRKEAASGKRSRVAAFPVEVMKVEARPHEVKVTSPGVIDAFEQIQITARVAGIVDRVNFSEGQEIKRGQILAYIDSRRYALAVSSARAAVAKAEAQAADAAASLKRRQNASESSPGLITGEELETFKTKLQTARADVESAREALKLARLNFDDSSVKAPADGVLQTRTVVTGQALVAGTVIGTLIRRDPMLLRFHATTAEAPRLKVGMLVNFKLKESRKPHQAMIKLVAASAEAESRLVPVTAEVEMEPGRKGYWLRPGSFADVWVLLAAERLVPLIPQTATRPSDRGFLAYVLDGAVARERKLQLGLHTADGWVEIREGLKVGDTLVVRGHEALAEGAKVRVVKPSSDMATPKDPGQVGAAAEKVAGERRKKAAPSRPADTASGERSKKASGPADTASEPVMPTTAP
jgi:membrane fusion protein, multidrug efflux system